MNEIDYNATIIWDYMLMHHELKKCDVIFVLGSRDDRVAEWAAELYHRGLGEQVIISGSGGHKNDLLQTAWGGETEAEHFAKIVYDRGIPETKVILETEATNTGENIQFTHKILQEKELHFTSFLLVQKPYMERRTYATFAAQWPEKDVNFVVSSPPISYEEYFNEHQPKKDVVNIMVGDLQRIIEYPKKGFQIPQEVPNHVMEAYDLLVQKGFTKHLIK